MADPCKHIWTATRIAYLLRRCKTCGVLSRNFSGKLRVMVCFVCKGPATEWRLGSPFCASHIPKPGNLRTLKDMNESEVKALEKLYGAPVRPRP